MKYIDEFRNQTISRKLLAEITENLSGKVNLMEVCGTHTVSIFRFGIKEMLPDFINLLSGPGCPVCVTSNKYIDHAISLTQLPGLILTSFGDMLKVPGSQSSLERVRAEGADIRIVYSSLDAVQLARDNPNRQVVFLGVGFETTIPTIAAAVLTAHREGLRNFSILSAIKVMPGALEALLQDPMVKIDGFILPGHVSTIIGMDPYRFIAEKYQKAAVITGFEPVDILQGILWLVRQIKAGEARIENQYSRGVRPYGNPVARDIIGKVFTPADSSWRGLGVLKNTGLVIRDEYREFDASVKFSVSVPETVEHPGCKCGDILRGIRTPEDCPLFGRTCSPEYPVGACMVSTEGTCAAYYKYRLKGA